MSELSPTQAFAVPPDDLEPGTSLWRDSWHRLKKNHLAVAGMIVVLVLLVACTFGLMLANSLGYHHETQDLALGATGPSWQHWMGTDVLGRDLFVRVLYGGRISLMVGLCATAVSLVIGVLYGASSGFLGGKTDAVMMRIVDIMYALPFTIFVILLMVFFGKKLVLIFLAIGAVEWLTMARIVRGQVLTLKRQELSRRVFQY
jgi:oligopeptide transport system permease protein